MEVILIIVVFWVVGKLLQERLPARPVTRMRQRRHCLAGSFVPGVGI